MNTPDARNAAENLLNDFAESLNTANTVDIASFYTRDGIFMPNGYKTLRAGDLARAGSKFLKKTGFKISYSIQNVAVEAELIFVDADAIATHIPTGGNLLVTRNTRDIFVLKKEETAWKIFRYVFNKNNP